MYISDFNCTFCSILLMLQSMKTIALPFCWASSSVLSRQYHNTLTYHFIYREHHNFLKLCLRLLSNHLALALAGGVATSILGRQARPLRNLLFRLMDSSVPDEIQEVNTGSHSNH